MKIGNIRHPYNDNITKFKITEAIAIYFILWRSHKILELAQLYYFHTFSSGRNNYKSRIKIRKRLKFWMNNYQQDLKYKYLDFTGYVVN